MLHLKCSSSGEPYREVSNIIANKKEIYQENSALLTSKGTGYLTYYFEKQGHNLPQNVFEGYTEENITQAVNKGKMIKTKKIEKESLLNYDILYVFSVSKDFDKNMLNFINENYDLIENNKNLKFSIYEKKNEM